MRFVKYFYIFDVTRTGIRIVTDCMKVIESLPLVFGQYIYDTSGCADNINIEIINKENNYIVNSYGRERRFKGIEQVFVFLGKILHTIEVTDSWLLLHGFMISRLDTNEAVALVGASRSGKSTLGTYLLNNNFEYVSDDLVIVNVNTMEILPFTRPIHLRAPSVAALQNCSLDLKLETNEVVSQRTLCYPDLVGQTTYMLKNIYFVKYGLPCNIAKCSLDHALKLLIENIYSIGSLPKSLRKCNYLASKLTFYKLDYSEVDYARVQIMKTW